MLMPGAALNMALRFPAADMLLQRQHGPLMHGLVYTGLPVSETRATAIASHPGQTPDNLVGRLSEVVVYIQYIEVKRIHPGMSPTTFMGCRASVPV